MADPLGDGGYPALYSSANATSLEGQQRFLRALRVRLAGLLVGTLGGGVFVSLGLVAFGGWVATAGFVAALLAELYVSQVRPDRAWYEGRAAAESVKTLAWRYSVRGESFASGDGGSSVEAEFLQRVGEVLDDLTDIQLSMSGSTSEQITSAMTALRASEFMARRAAYREGRIEDQRAWYATKAGTNKEIAHRWSLAVFLFEGLGVTGGILTITGALHIDLLGICAATAATITAWVQAKQYDNLATAYSLTAQELATIKTEIDGLGDDSRWPTFVGQAEEAISREHTLWRASRGIRIRIPSTGS